MYAKLRIELDSSQISYQQSSNLQGVLMEQIDTDYAQELHQYSLNPYSQYVVKEKDKTVWYISTVNEGRVETDHDSQKSDYHKRCGPEHRDTGRK